MSPSAEGEQLRLIEARVHELERQLARQQQTERWLHARDTATRALVSSSSLAEAAPALVEGICRAMGWPVGSDALILCRFEHFAPFR